MNFQSIPPVESAAQLIEISFRRAREAAARAPKRKTKGNKEYLAFCRKKELRKIGIVQDVLSSRLDKILQQFPKENELNSFYRKLLHLTLEYVKYKQSLGAVHWAKGKIHELWSRHQSLLGKAAALQEVSHHGKSYYGRTASVLRQINGKLQELEKCRKVLRTFPDIKEMCTVCIYGFPNVGKTTLLNALTGSRAKVAAYSFTTTGINAGYSTVDGEKLQLLDVPGTLARPTKANPIELQAELVLEELAAVVIFVFDFSGQSGFSREKQLLLYEKVKAKKPVLIYCSKQDIIPEEELRAFPLPHLSLEELRRELAAYCNKT